MAVRLGVPESVAGGPLVRRLAWTTATRLVLLVVALGAVVVINLSRGFAVGSSTIQIALALLACSFALAGAYAAVLRRGGGLEGLATAQLVLDQAAWTVLVYLTGGAASGATSFYGITCLLGVFLTGLRGAAVAGAAGAVGYVGLAVSLHRGWLSPPADQPGEVYVVTTEALVYHVVVNLLVIVVVTLLSSFLAERLRSASGRIVEAEARAESAERLAVLGRLAAALAHEIRNPLGSIAGSIQLLRTSTVLSEDEQRLCEIIQREAARLDDLVSDMMDVARPRKPEMQILDVARLAREVVALASKSGRGTDVVIRYFGEDSAGVEADGAQLRQLVWNLVRNAVQAASAGGSVEVHIEEASGNIVLAVKDDGVGIDPEAQERMFDAFYTSRSHGTGIGLAVVKRIADEHGFPLQVRSERGAGATFVVTLGRRRRLDGDAPLVPPPHSSVPPPPGDDPVGSAR